MQLWDASINLEVLENVMSVNSEHNVYELDVPTHSKKLIGTLRPPPPPSCYDGASVKCLRLARKFFGLLLCQI